MKLDKNIFTLFVIIFLAWAGISRGAPVTIHEAEIAANDETMIANVTIAGYDDFSATDVTQDCTYQIISANFASDFSAQATGYVKTGPDLKVNDSDGPVTLPYGSRVIITAHMNPESSEIGAMRDWWVVKYAPDGWYYRWGTGFWDYIPDLTYIEPTVQAGLGFIPSYTLIDSTNLSRGTYTYYFGVDAFDGYLTDLLLEYDSVTITIY